MLAQKTIIWKNTNQTHDYEYHQKGSATNKREGKI